MKNFKQTLKKKEQWISMFTQPQQSSTHNQYCLISNPPILSIPTPSIWNRFQRAGALLFITFCSSLYLCFPSNGIVWIVVPPNLLNIAPYGYSSLVVSLPNIKSSNLPFPASLALMAHMWDLKIRPTWRRTLVGTQVTGGNRRGSGNMSLGPLCSVSLANVPRSWSENIFLQLLRRAWAL